MYSEFDIFLLNTVLKKLRLDLEITRKPRSIAKHIIMFPEIIYLTNARLSQEDFFSSYNTFMSLTLECFGGSLTSLGLNKYFGALTERVISETESFISKAKASSFTRKYYDRKKLSTLVTWDLKNYALKNWKGGSAQKQMTLRKFEDIAAIIKNKPLLSMNADLVTAECNSSNFGIDCEDF